MLGDNNTHLRGVAGRDDEALLRVLALLMHISC